MSKFPSAALLLGATLLIAGPAAAEGDAARGETVFKKCAACHQVGPGAKNRVGPHLTGVMGRTAGSLDGFKYSKAMTEAGNGGLVWDSASLDGYLEAPRTFIKGNRMAFPGLKDAKDRADVIAYLTLKPGQAAAPAAEPAETKAADAASAAAAAPAATDQAAASHGVLHLGRVATADEIAAWDIDVRPDGAGLPAGRGTVADGEALFTERCASCHGDFGEGTGRWPVLAGGRDTLTADRPEKTIGSYWPYLSTVYDYVRRSMPFGDARSLSDDEVYAITAYLLYLNDVVTDTDFELSRDNFAEVRLPNEANFIADDRAGESHYAAKGEPCMQDCKPAAKITMRARVLDVTPEAGKDNEATTKVD
ncbi:MAG: c-type cytochrome [Thalassobaculum sp.]|uniref:c-type cytochrome n=1 Tax=Thalassobaculum sp. TaxID=2022740 RepID=UPI0032ED3FCE